MKDWRIPLIGLFAAAVLVLCIALSFFSVRTDTTPEQREYKVGVILKAMDSEYWLSVRSSMERTARENGIRLIVMAPENESASDEQEQIARDLLAGGVDALLISPVDIDQAAVYRDMASEAHIPLFTIDERIDGIPYIGSDNYTVGCKAAEYIAAHLPPGAETAVIAGSWRQDAHLQRIEGFLDTMNALGFPVSEVIADAAQYRQASVQTEALLTRRPQIRGIFVTSAIMSLGVVDATAPLDGHIVTVGVDTQNDALLALKNGRLDAMISQDGNETGRLAIETVRDSLQGCTRDVNYIENAVITPENADNYLLQEDF